MYELLVKNGKIVTADSVKEGDIAVKDGKIAAILSPGVEVEAERSSMRAVSMCSLERSIRTRI